MTQESQRRRRNIPAKRRQRRRLPGSDNVVGTAAEQADNADFNVDTTGAASDSAEGVPDVPRDGPEDGQDAADGASVSPYRVKGVPGFARGNPGRPRRQRRDVSTDVEGAGVEALRKRLIDTICDLSKADLKRIVLKAPQPEQLLSSLLSLGGDGSGGGSGVTIISRVPSADMRAAMALRDEPSPSWGSRVEPAPAPEPVTDEPTMPPLSQDEQDRIESERRIAEFNRGFLEDQDVSGTSRRAWRKC